MTEKQIDHQETQQLLAYLRGELAQDDIKAIEARLMEEEALRQKLLEISAEESELTDWAKAQKVQSGLETVFDDVEVPQEKYEKNEIGERPTKRLLHPGLWLSTGVAAAIVILGLSALKIFNEPKQLSPAPEGLARVVNSLNASWSVQSLDESQPLIAGDYALNAGSIDLEFNDGARVSVNGPAAFSIKNAGHLHMQSGKLVARIPDEAIGFMVTSPQSEVVDLGTAFGMAVNDSGETEVHVLDGQVEVMPKEAKDSKQRILLAKGQSRKIIGFGSDTKVIPISAGDSQFTLAGENQSEDYKILRGSVRIATEITKADLYDVRKGPSYIQIIAEQQHVELPSPLAVSVTEPGRYAQFIGMNKTLPAGTKVNCYLLHFRPRSEVGVKAVIRFNKPVAAVLCQGDHIFNSDDLFRVPNVYYHKNKGLFRGLEPHAESPVKVSDQLVLSQDKQTIGITTYAGAEVGFDQIRVLTLAE